MKTPVISYTPSINTNKKKRLTPICYREQEFIGKEPIKWINRILLETELLYLKLINNKSIIVSAEFLLPAQQFLILNALIDNGASARKFIDRSLVKLKNIRIYKTPYIRTLILVDDRAAIEKITNYIIAPLKIGNYNKNALFFIIKLLLSRCQTQSGLALSRDQVKSIR
jgi:hypothetical protein